MIIKPKIPKVYLLGVVFSVLFVLGVLSSIFWHKLGLNQELAEYVWSAGQDLSEIGLILCVRAFFRLILYLQSEKGLLLEYGKHIKKLWYMVAFAFDLAVFGIIDSLFVSAFVISLPKFINLYIAIAILLYRVLGIHEYIKGKFKRK